jgi:hypothetical protein
MLFPDWESFFAARADNETGNKNTSVITEAWSPETNDEQRFQTLTSDPNMVIFAAGENKKLLTFHGFKNAGGTLLRPENKLMCLLGTGASAIAIEINSKQLVANCKLSPRQSTNFANARQQTKYQQSKHQLKQD